MKIKILDFELLTRHYRKYQESIIIIEKEKEKLLKEIKPLQDKINLCIKNNIDNSEIMYINQQIISKESEFKNTIRKISDETNIICYNEISEIVKKWASDNFIDIVLSSNEVVFSKVGIDSTNDILELFKIHNLFVE
jgi:Skp family chaperone for outer membrane proteins